MAEQIRVLAVIRHPVGGIRSYLKYTYGSLDRKRYRFTIVTVEDAEGRLLERDLSGFEVLVFRAQGRWRLAAMVRDIFLLCWNRKVDIIHSHGLTAAVLAIIGNLPAGLPHIITPHAVVSSDQFAGVFGGVQKWLLGHLLNRADVIHCVSHDLRTELLMTLPVLSRCRSKCTVIRNGVHLDPTREDNVDHRGVLRVELGLNPGTFVFGFLGRFMPEKGFKQLIDAIEVLSREKDDRQDIRVLAVNDGAFIREYRAAIEQKQLSEYFIFYGFTPDIERIILGVDAVVIPSLSEACPLVPMEAFVLGCPVVASDCTGLREIVRDTPAVIVKQVWKPDEFASVLWEVIRRREGIKKDAKEFASKARDRFDAKQTTMKLDALLRRVLGGEPLPL